MTGTSPKTEAKT